MKLCDIIRQKRLEKGLTQEQVANLLGVSTPAVNKWEKDVSYPDITLLPPLARLLGTDLNTLLSFQEDLTPQEVGLFLNELCELAASQGIQTAFDRADEKLREFPACDLLLLNTALTLDGLVAFMAEEESGASSSTVGQQTARNLPSLTRQRPSSSAGTWNGTNGIALKPFWTLCLTSHHTTRNSFRRLCTRSRNGGRMPP